MKKIKLSSIKPKLVFENVENVDEIIGVMAPALIMKKVISPKKENFDEGLRGSIAGSVAGGAVGTAVGGPVGGVVGGMVGGKVGDKLTSGKEEQTEDLDEGIGQEALRAAKVAGKQATSNVGPVAKRAIRGFIPAAKAAAKDAATGAASGAVQGAVRGAVAGASGVGKKYYKDVVTDPQDKHQPPPVPPVVSGENVEEAWGAIAKAALPLAKRAIVPVAKAVGKEVAITAGMAGGAYAAKKGAQKIQQVRANRQAPKPPPPKPPTIENVDEGMIGTPGKMYRGAKDVARVGASTVGGAVSGARQAGLKGVGALKGAGKALAIGTTKNLERAASNKISTL